MALLNLGSKSEAFCCEGQTWRCKSGLPSDITIEIGEMSFYLHKFPLLSRSGLLEKLMSESTKEDGLVCVLQLTDIPGGAKAFELVAKFCYGVRFELTPLNVVSLRCASEYLQMTNEYGEGNLVAQTEAFLNDVFGNWTDTIKALETCEEVLPHAEELHIVSRCINSLAMKAYGDSKLLNWPVMENSNDNTAGSDVWNGISTGTKSQPMTDDWWYEDVSFLSLPLYKRLIQAVEAGGMRPENISGALVFYAKKYIPLMNRQASFKDASHAKSASTPSEADQRALLEEIVELLPKQKGVTETRFLLRLLRTAMMLQVSPSCRENLEGRVGLQLDQATLDDLLIPNIGYSVETLYDIDCFQRILDHFLLLDQASAAASPCIMEENQLVEGNQSLASITRVANLVDSYLSEVAPDVNFKFPKFQSLAAAIPDYARPHADGIYRAIDIYLKAHPWLTDIEREQICRLMNCQKLSLEASTHAAQNERLPLRVIVQVLFFEQLRLRTSISGWFFVSDNLDNSQNLSGGMGQHGDNTRQGRGSSIEDMRGRVSELEKECNNMKEEFQKLVKTKRRWNIFCRRKSQCNSKSGKPSEAATCPTFPKIH
ncbi:BTB/POZ domain-containing protein At5g03250-like isoform X1 [Nicotiana tabacum]|uniref:BTB/POZ domain-containing protein At5g03250-like n=1 Tax=Nicotiana tabacum TaxID=4097 RepID=A0A1S3X4V9_TOBAC|nr:PREDICTED: BTB/POZ domain-containing protein At5g03250-like [Nicotiana tabacum]